jgi:BMFP domain-containing protein YqiC
MDNGQQPATKEDVALLRSETQHLHDNVIETMRDVQTELLKAFYNYAQTTDIKLKDGEAADFMARQRLTAVESRVTDIEKRLNMPPQSAN